METYDTYDCDELLYENKQVIPTLIVWCAMKQQDLLQRAEKFGVTPEIQQKLEALDRKHSVAEELRVSQRDPTRIVTTFHNKH